MAGQVIKSPFRLGGKEVYLPNFKVTFLRTPALPPTFASFLVPLHLNKLDMRDYLYHVYNVRTLSIRSTVLLQKITQGRELPDTLPTPRRWRRPLSKKKMTVELEKPFVWPEVPDEETLNQAFNADTFRAGQEDQEEYSAREGHESDRYVNYGQREKMREQAQRLLKGEVKWRGGAQKN